MDVTVEAAPMTAEVKMGSSFVAISGFPFLLVALPQSEAAASTSRPRRHSIIARGPNSILRKELVPAAA